jgi:hypothetical protein
MRHSILVVFGEFTGSDPVENVSNLSEVLDSRDTARGIDETD